MATPILGSTNQKGCRLDASSLRSSPQPNTIKIITEIIQTQSNIEVQASVRWDGDNVRFRLSLRRLGGRRGGRL